MRNVNLNILKFLRSINNFYLSLSKIGLEVRSQESGDYFYLLSPHPPPISLLYNNYSQPEIPWVPIILCAFCQKNFFFAIKLHKKKIIVVGEID
ncbi:MAG: hypothetical protein ACK4YL_24480 [Microcystis sp.]|uniref:hypothetical protein n=1 Tax=Microcystis sp. TaxID=1127 RepID=UPI0039192411